MVVRPARPRVLHLLSDWKCAGPAAPIVDLVRHLRRAGFPVDLACARPPAGQPATLPDHARARHVEPVLDFALRRGFNLIANLADLQKLTAYLDREEVQIVHAHTAHDHLIGSRAARRAGFEPRVVRTNHRGAPLPPTFWTRQLVEGHTDAWVAPAPSCLEADLAHFNIPGARGIVAEGTVDLERFDPAAPLADVRGAFGLTEEHVLFGVAVPVRRERRLQVLVPALAEAMRVNPSVRAAVLDLAGGVGDAARSAAVEFGIAEKLFVPGDVTARCADYLNALDVLVFVSPESDGACQIVREAMAMGKPVLAARRGILADLVEDGVRGRVIDDTRDGLARAIIDLARARGRRERFGRAAAEHARECFAIARQVERIGNLYMRLAEGK